MSELLPCPFCGDTAMAQRVGPNGNKWWELQCGGCGIVGPDRGNESAAIAAWNTRTSQWNHDMEAGKGEGQCIEVLICSIEGVEIAWWSDGQNEWLTQVGKHTLAEPTKWMSLPDG